MIELIVKKNYQGRVAIRQHYLKKAQDYQEDLTIFYGAGRMRIPWGEVYSLSTGTSDKKFIDRYGKHPPEFLYFYNWKPDTEQGVLV